MKARYLIQEAWRSATRRRTGFLVAAVIIAICLTLLSSFLVVTINVLDLLRVATQRGEVYVFMDDAVAEKPTELLARTAQLGGVRSVRFVSKEAAIDELRADLGADVDLIDALNENPLPASIRLGISADATSAAELDALERKLRLLPGVTEVWSGKELIAQINRALRSVVALDLLLLLVVSGATIFIVFQSVDNSISSRQREIEIMELVGATGAVVKVPFLIVGMVQGALGGVAAFAAVALVHRVLCIFVAAPRLPLGALALFDSLLGVSLGLLGAGIALARGKQASTNPS